MEEKTNNWISNNPSLFGKGIAVVLTLFGISLMVGAIKNWNWLYQADGHYQNNWSMGQISRYLGKTNYQIHTDAIKENLIPQEITKQQASFVYANEADLQNVALFGITAKVWRENNLNKKGNVRDDASLEQLVVLSNMESINALLIGQGL